jgi:hypothetical protein
MDDGTDAKPAFMSVSEHLVFAKLYDFPVASTRYVNCRLPWQTDDDNVCSLYIVLKTRNKKKEKMQAI